MSGDERSDRLERLAREVALMRRYQRGDGAENEENARKMAKRVDDQLRELAADSTPSLF